MKTLIYQNGLFLMKLVFGHKFLLGIRIHSL